MRRSTRSITGEEGEHDRRIVLDRAPRFAILDEPQSIQYRVLDTDLPPGTRVTVRLRVDGTEVASDQVTVGEPHIDRRAASRTPAAASRSWRWSRAENELALENNVAVAEIDVVREHLRVLLVSGEPHAGERTWRNVLKSDAAVDLVHFTILRPPEKQDGTPINELSLIAFPTRELFEEKIDEFDLIIFDRYQSRGVLPIVYYDNLARYVRDGGAVLVAAGPDYAASGSLYRTPLGPVLPAVPTGEIIEEPYRATISPVGLRHPVTRALPGAASDPPAWSQWFRLVDADAIAGDITMTGPGGRPLLVLAHEGEGRVAMLLSDQAWLWARGYRGRRPACRAAAAPAALADAGAGARGGGADGARGRPQSGGRAADAFRGASRRSPSPIRPGKAEPLTLTEAEPGLWRGVVEDAPLGLHRAQDGDADGARPYRPGEPGRVPGRDLDHRAPAPDRRCNRRLGRAALAARTASIPRISPVSSRAPASGRDWIGLRRSEATVLKSIDQLPLLGGLLGLALLVGAFSALWYREAR